MSGQAVQFGAGNIGRGFMGQLFFESGLETTFVDVAQETIDALNARGGYPVRIVGEGEALIEVNGVRALHAADAARVAEAVANADIVATAVGAAVLPKIAPVVAQGIVRRLTAAPVRPLNIILCENLLHVSDAFAAMLDEAMPAEWTGRWRAHVGLVEASIGRMVPVMTEKQRREDPLLVCVEAYCELPVDAQGFRGPVPPIAHMKAIPNFQSYVERKLYIHNAAHAAAAYLGHLRGHRYIWEAIEDAKVAAPVRALAEASRSGLVARHGMDAAALHEHIEDLMRRFANRALGDQIARVARDPIRKLQPGDRLLGAIALCIETGAPPEPAGFAAAAAIRYDHPGDDAARAVQRALLDRGLDGVLHDICGLQPDSPLATPIRAGHERLLREGWIGTIAP